VAGGAGGGGGVVLAEHPRGGIEVHPVLQVPEGDAVLALLVDLLLGMVGAEVALAAVLRLARAARGEVVAGVAGGAGAAGAVEVHAPDAGVGPGLGIDERLALLVPRDGVPVHRRGVEGHRRDAAPLGEHELPGVHHGPVLRLQRHLAPVALAAAGGGEGLAVHLHRLPRVVRVGDLEGAAVALDDLGQQVVEGVEDVAGLGVVARLELGGLAVVALPAVGGGHDGGDPLPVVLPRVEVGLLGLVAGEAVDVPLRVGGVRPLGDDAGGGLLVARHAGALPLRRGFRRGRLLGHGGRRAPGDDEDGGDRRGGGRGSEDRPGAPLHGDLPDGTGSSLAVGRRRARGIGAGQ
jgi:hypothetical protein